MTTTSESIDRPAPSLSRRLRLLIAGLVVARGVVGLCTTPLFEGWDEYQHVGYIVHIQETGRRAILNETLVPNKVIAAVFREFPQPEAARIQFPTIMKPASYESYWRAGGRAPSAVGVPATEDLKHETRLYQAQHSWWYYVLVSPLFQALGGVDNLRSSVAGLRLLNLAFTVGAVWIALGVIAARVRDPRTAGWIALLIGLQPLIVMNGCRVSSDAPGMFFAVCAVARMMRLAMDERRLLAASARVGLLMGLAIVMKATNFALIPAAGIAWLLGTIRVRPSVADAFGSAAVMGLVVAALIGPDVAHSMSLYGIPTPMQEALENRAKGRGPADLLRALKDFSPVAYGHWVFSQGLFVQGGWSFVPSVQAVTALYGRFINYALLGLVFSAAAWAVRRGLIAAGFLTADRRGTLVPAVDSIGTVLMCAAVCAGFAAALIYHALQSALAWGVTTTGPWYASPALPWFLMLVGLGARGWPRLVATGIVAGLEVLSIAGEQTSRWLCQAPFYSGGADGLEALGRITSLQPWYLSTATCIVAMVAGASLFLTAVVLIGRAASTSVADSIPAKASTRPAWLGLGHRVDSRGGAIPSPSLRPAGEPAEESDLRTTI